MRQIELEPLFIDSSDHELDPGPGIKLFYRAHCEVIVFEATKSPVFYEVFKVVRQTPCGFWIGGNNSTEKFVKRHAPLESGKRTSALGFAQPSKEQARIALAYRVLRAHNNAEVTLSTEYRNADVIARKYPELGSILNSVLAPEPVENDLIL